MISVGIVGDRHHAARLKDVLERSGLADVAAIYHPDRVPEGGRGTREFKDLLAQDAVVVASPNRTHFAYLERLGGTYDGYVFCEKPPVATRDELDRLQIDPERTFFNFNYRFSRLRDAIEAGIEDGSLGTPLHFHAAMAQGLAFKDSYPASWRADGANHLNAILDTKAIHYVDLACELFGKLERCDYATGIAAGTGTAFDTCTVNLVFESNVTATLFASYAAPLVTEVQVIGTNGVIEYSGNRLRGLGPRDTFDARGYFAPPPERILKDYGADGDGMYEESLDRSMRYFLEHCRDRAPFPAHLADASLRANRLLFDLMDA